MVTASGMNCFRAIHEPVATFIAHDLDKDDPDNEVYFLIIDISGIQMNLHLMRIEEGIFDKVQSQTIEYGGGNQIDQNLLEYCYA